MNNFKIDSIRKLQITKVKPWSVYFTYDGEKYLLHGTSSGYDDYVFLYRRDWSSEKQKYILQEMAGSWTDSDDVENFCIKYRGKGRVYNQIDKSYFVRKLKELHLIETNLKLKEKTIKKNSSRLDGLTKAEGVVMDNLIKAWNAFCKLETTHPNEKSEFVEGINKCQELLGLRVLRRDYPLGYSTYKQE